MPFGKPNRKTMRATVFRQHGAPSDNVLVGPKPGVDVSVLRLGKSSVVVGSTDPISFIPKLGADSSAFLSVHGIASDVATSGISPRYAFFGLNLPLQMSDEILTRYWSSIHRHSSKLGISILGGHTGRFAGLSYTVVGAGTMLGMGLSENYVTAAMAHSGDAIIATKSAALESAAVLASVFPRTVKKAIGEKDADQASRLLRLVTTVADSRIAASGGLRKVVTAMHDVTEGGIVSAVIDMAKASGLYVRVDLRSVPLYREVSDVCRLFKINPYTSLGQGSLLVATRPKGTNRVLRLLRNHRIEGEVIGALSDRGRNLVTDLNGFDKPLQAPATDPYWRAYWNGVRKGLE
jgi:hydrogenase expression/formation protein HypE